MLKSLVIHRNLTHSYQNILHKEKQKVHRFDISNLDAPLLDKNRTNNVNGSVSFTNAICVDILPDWIQLADECNYMLSTVRDKVKELEKAQNMNILNVFGKTGRNEYERISNLSKDINFTFKKIEINMESISKEVDDYVEHHLRTNAKAKIASELIPLSFTFRKIQKSFYDSLQNDSQNRYNKPEISVNNNYVTQELVQDSVQVNHENIADRTMRLQQIAVTVQDLKDMYTQLSTMLVEQGSMLDQIDYNVREFSKNSHKFAQELKIRQARDNPQRAVKTIRYLLSVIFVQDNMAGGGGALNKLFPGYKDKIWNRLPVKVRLHFINSWNNKLISSTYSDSVLTNSKIKSFNKFILDPLKPSYAYRSPGIDYKKQRARGTLIEGVDYYLPTLRVQQRLANFFEPYTDEENFKRSKYRYQSLKVYVLAALGVTIVHGYMQRRPVAWCSNIDPPKAPSFPFWFKPATHSHDIAAVRRGFEVYRQVCSTCHSLRYLKFRHLVDEVYPLQKVKDIAAEYEIEDGPNDQGEMYTRSRLYTDPFPEPYPNNEAARFANNGAVPPDLTLMASARKQGPDYIFSLLTGYTDPPEGFSLREGLHFNSYFPGGSIGMAPPLEDGMLEYEDGTPATVSQMAKDVASFIVWTSDPMNDERRNMYMKMLIGTTLGAIAMSLWYRFIWAIAATSRKDFTRLARFK